MTTRRMLLGGLAMMSALSALTTRPAAPQPAGPPQGTSPPCIDAPAVARAAMEKKTGTTLVLLGTGAGPVLGLLSPIRQMAANVILSGGRAYVIDCGIGITEALGRIGVPLATLSDVYITHHHPDHNAEYGPLLLLAWVNGRLQTIHAYGPPPLFAMTKSYVQMQQATINFWIEDIQAPPFPSIDVHEISIAGTVKQDQFVKVTSAVVQHPPIVPAFAYRFDFSDRSITFSGDTVPLRAVADLARGSDVLVHETMYLPAMEASIRGALARNPGARLPGVDSETAVARIMDHMRRDHSPVEDVGRIATEAGVKTLVLSHITPSGPMVSDAFWRERAATTFAGEIIVAHDYTVV